MHWWTEHEAKETRTDRTALLRLLCACDPGWLWSADHYFGERGKTSTRQRPQPKKNRGVSRYIGYDTDWVFVPGFKIFCLGLRKTFIWKNGRTLMYLSPRVRRNK